MSRAVSAMPVAWIWSRHGAIPGMPAAASASTTARSDLSCFTVAVLIERKRLSGERSRIGSGVDAVAAQHRRHAARGKLGVGEEARGIGEAEQLGEVGEGAGALL